MKSGSLDRFVTLRRATVTTDAMNAQVLTWADLARVPCKYTPVSDGERWRAAEMNASITARFVIRYSNNIADIGPKDRLIYEGREFDIVGAKELQRLDGIEISAAARAE
jgi:SPP1 family predicted phage head-tail adaptor